MNQIVSHYDGPAQGVVIESELDKFKKILNK